MEHRPAPRWRQPRWPGVGWRAMIRPPNGMGIFHFVRVAMLRAAQLQRGCVPRVTGHYTAAATARWEVAEGKVAPVIETSATAAPVPSSAESDTHADPAVPRLR